jgi:hypothetical protein
MLFLLCVLFKVLVVVFHFRVSFRKTGSLQVLVSRNALLVCIWEHWLSCVKTGIFVPIIDQIRSWCVQELFPCKSSTVYWFWWFSYRITCACNKILFNNTIWISQFLCLIFSRPGMDNKRIILVHFNDSSALWYIFSTSLCCRNVAVLSSYVQWMFFQTVYWWLLHYIIKQGLWNCY